MVFGDLGRYPVEFFIKQRTLNYWGKIITSMDHKINKILYQLAITLEKKRILKKSDWLLYVKTALNDCNMYNCWLNQSICEKSLVLFKRNVKKALTNYYSYKWKEDINNSNLCYNYRIFKEELKLEEGFYRNMAI